MSKIKKTVVIAEKPNTASKIKAVITEPGVVVVPARGHVVEIQYPEHMMTGKWYYPIVEMPKDLVYTYDKSSADVLSRIVDECRDADMLVSATDLDREGSAIFTEILFYLQSKFGPKYKPELKRMYYSSLTTAELKHAWSNLEDYDWGRSYAGLTRNIQDMQWGINLTRALTLATQKFCKQDVLSSGRVQTPMLKLIRDRDAEIETFVPKEYYQLKIKCMTAENETFEALYQGKIDSMDKLMSILGDLTVGDKCKASVSESEQVTPPPPPFNGTSLQIEGNRVLGFSAKLIADRQSGLAQKLYMSALISYPGTDSEKYPADWGDPERLEFRKLLDSVLGGGVMSYMTRPGFVEGKKTDEAHPCIRTMAVPGPAVRSELGKDVMSLFELITRRCASGSCGDAIVAVKDITLVINKHRFKATGKTYKDKGWLNIYHYNIKDDKLLPDILDGDIVTIKSTTHQKKDTQPPPRFNTVALIAHCDKLGLGTKNTRPGIVEKLEQRGFLDVVEHGKKSVLRCTELGGRVIDVLDKHAPVITDKELTTRFNDAMNSVEKDPKKFDKENEKMLNELIQILGRFKAEEDVIGAGIARVNASDIIKCPKCGKYMTVHESDDPDRVNFYGCVGYPECDGKLFYHTEETIRFGVTCKACSMPCVSGVLNPGAPEYLRCMGDCEGSPLRCERCGKKVFVGRSKKAGRKLYSLCRDCSLFNKFKVDMEAVSWKDVPTTNAN